MRLGILAALPLVLALALTGCGSDGEDGSGVASGGGAKQSGAAGGEKLSKDEKGVKFAQCMREHGVQMDDPKPGKGGQLTVKGLKKEVMDKAMEACRQYSPQVDATGAPDPQEQERGRKFAECMRQNGVEGFQDPKPGQRGIMIDKKVGEDPDFEQADQKCKKILQGGGK